MTVWTVQDLKEWNAGLRRSPEGDVKLKVKGFPCNYPSFASELLKRSRLLSQLIAKSWLPGDEARQIREIFTSFSTGHDDSDLKQLLTGKKKNLWPTRIFEDDEIDLYRFEITWDSFEGSLEDKTQAIAKQTPPYFTLVLPYPPRPALGEFTVTEHQIQEWVDSQPQEVNGVIQDPFPSYPYLPTTTA